MKEEETRVYVICKEEDGTPVAPCKIGVTKYPGYRMQTFQTASPFKLCFYKSYLFPFREMAMHIEKAFHALHKEHCLHGEWFDMDPEEAAELLRLYCSLEIWMTWPELRNDFPALYEKCTGYKYVKPEPGDWDIQ